MAKVAITEEVVDSRHVEEFAPIESVDKDGVVRIVSSGQNSFGQEVPDGVPMEVPLGFRNGPTLADTIRRMVQNEQLRAAAQAEGFDSFEDAEDFDIPDDPIDPRTDYEAVFDPVPSPPAPSSVQEAAKPSAAVSEPGVASPPASAPASPDSTST